MEQFSKLNEMYAQLGKMQVDAKREAERALNGLSKIIPQKDFNGVKNLTNFEDVNTEAEALKRIEEIKAWAQQLQG